MVAAACGGGTATHTISGTFVLQDPVSQGVEGEACSGEGGYRDIRDGAGVTVRDQDGEIIGTSSLTGGHLVLVSTRFELFYCTWTYAVPDLPDRAFYSVEVGHRGEQRYSQQQLVERAWTVDLSLGA